MKGNRFLLKVWGMYEGYSSGDAASVMVSTNRDGEAEFRINHWGLGCYVRGMTALQQVSWQIE
ncbi:MAG: hypothetical protein ACLUIQ_07070 [Dialister invisus]